MKIVGIRGGDTFLIETTPNRGFVYVAKDGSKSPEMLLDAFLKFGYWYPYEGTLTAEELLKSSKGQKEGS